MLTVVLLVILFACVACLFAQGMWGNAIRLINVVTAGLLATNFFEPLAEWLDSQADTYTYVWDFLALWGLFAVFLIVMRIATSYLSQVKVRFLKIADQIGSVILALWIGWVMVCFTTMTMHTAPLAKNFMYGGFQPEQRMFMGLAPDRQWLAFVQTVSRGSFSRSATPRQQESQDYGFDPDSEFMLRYNTRRIDLQNHVEETGKIRVRR